MQANGILMDVIAQAQKMAKLANAQDMVGTQAGAGSQQQPTRSTERVGNCKIRRTGQQNE